MSAAPQIVTRAEQPYVAIKAQVTIETLGTVVPPLNQEVFAWLGERGVVPAGAPFWKYDVIDMPGKLEVEAGVPVTATVEGDGRVISGVLPAGATRRSGTWVTRANSPRLPGRCSTGPPSVA
jgi:hypothetical protein